ncbi:unnamed protein product, partial [Ectocarpus sp. 12 AP-2014]
MRGATRYSERSGLPIIRMWQQSSTTDVVVANTACHQMHFVISLLVTFQGKYEEAESLYARSLAIYEKAYGPDHPGVATGFNNLAGLLCRQGKYTEVKPFYARCQAIFGKALGSEQPNVATAHNKPGRYTEAIPLLERALAIRTKKRGENHPHTVVTRNNLKI